MKVAAVVLLVKGGVLGPFESFRLEESLNMESRGDDDECTEESSCSEYLGISAPIGET
tara:strand:- start:1181 stop:1354 length:174 start_codon:yes stop_codon:yes gene_type:complete